MVVEVSNMPSQYSHEIFNGCAWHPLKNSLHFNSIHDMTGDMKMNRDPCKYRDLKGNVVTWVSLLKIIRLMPRELLAILQS